MKTFIFYPTLTILIILTTSSYCQNIQSNSTSAHISATIYGTDDMHNIGYNYGASTLTIQNSNNTLYDIYTKLPDTLIDVLTGKKVAVKFDLKDSIYKIYSPHSNSYLKIKTIFEQNATRGIYVSKDTTIIIVHYY